MTDNLRAMLIRHEGLKLKLYRDTVGKLTIGVGHNIEDEGITEAMAYFILDEDIAKHAVEAQKLPMYYLLDEVRQDALVDLTFNIGLNRVRGFVKMLGALSDGNWDKAAAELLDSKYAQQVGNRAIELAEMLRTGKYA